MAKAFLIVLLLLSSIAVSASAQSFAIAEDTTSQPLFSDDFTGNSLNSMAWNYQENLNASGLPAYGGQIVVNDSYVA